MDGLFLVNAWWYSLKGMENDMIGELFEIDRIVYKQKEYCFNSLMSMQIVLHPKNVNVDSL